MKKSICFASAVWLCSVLTAAVSAAPIGDDNTGVDYLLARDAGLDSWRCGVNYAELTRTITDKSTGIEESLKTTKTMAYLGYDLFRWLTVYGTIGENTSELKDWGTDLGTAVEYGGGVHASLLDHEITDPTLMENRFRVTAGAQYTITEASNDFLNWEWEELFAFLNFSIVNDVKGDKFYLPESIAIYAGPIFSNVRSNDIEQNSSDQFGYNVGVELYFSDVLSFDVGFQELSDSGMTAGAHLRF